MCWLYEDYRNSSQSPLYGCKGGEGGKGSFQDAGSECLNLSANGKYDSMENNAPV